MGGKGSNAPSDKQMTQLAGPWQPLQGPLQATIQRAQRISFRPNEYGPGVVSGFDPATLWGQNQNLGIAQAGAPGLTNAYNFAGGVAGGGQVGQEPGYGALANVANSGVNDPAAAARQATLNQSMGGSGGLDYLRNTAAGNMLGQNPYIDKLVSDTLGDANRTLLPSLEGRMSQAGRLGSNAEAVGQGEIAKQLGSLANNIRYGDYSNERSLQQQAGLALPGAFSTELGAQTAAQNSQSQDAYQRLQMQLGAAGQAGDAYRADTAQALGAAGQLPQNYAAQFLPGQQAQDIGNARQAQQERFNQEAQQRFQFNQADPYNRLSNLLGNYQSIGGLTNPSAANAAYAQSLNQPSDFQTALGTGVSLAGLAAGGAGAYMGGGAGTAGLLNYLGGSRRAGYG